MTQPQNNDILFIGTLLWKQRTWCLICATEQNQPNTSNHLVTKLVYIIRLSTEYLIPDLAERYPFHMKLSISLYGQVIEECRVWLRTMAIMDGIQGRLDCLEEYCRHNRCEEYKITAAPCSPTYTHSITMTSWWPRWRLKSPASRLFTQAFIQPQIKECIKAPRHWPLCVEFIGDRWIPRTTGQ